jgi:hypothetical protein
VPSQSQQFWQAVRHPWPVDVFRGQRLSADQTAAAEGVVTEGGRFAFRLPAGDYVLFAHWAGSNLAPPIVSVHVTAGKITTQNLDYQGYI